MFNPRGPRRTFHERDILSVYQGLWNWVVSDRMFANTSLSYNTIDFPLNLKTDKQTLLDLVKPYNVVLWLQGHGHADIDWSVNGVPATMVAGLYQGSYDIIEVGSDELKISKEQVQQLTEALYPRTTDAYYATVQKLLERLEGKGCVRRDRSARAHVFAAAVNRDEIIGRRLEAMAEKLCGGSLTPLLTNLVRSRRLTPKERREIRKLMDELDN